MASSTKLFVIQITLASRFFKKERLFRNISGWKNSKSYEKKKQCSRAPEKGKVVQHRNRYTPLQ